MQSQDQAFEEPKFTSDPQQYGEGKPTSTPDDESTDTATPPVAMKPPREEKVEEASWESFPASDPPSYSGGIT